MPHLPARGGRWALPLLLVVPAAAFGQAAPASPAASPVRAEIEAANERFEDAFRRQDAEALAALYTPDAALYPPGADPVTGGRDAVREFWAGAFASGLDGVDLVTVDVRPAGDVAYEQGIATLHAGGAVTAVADYTVFWKRTAEGWRLHHDLWTPTGGAPSVHRLGEAAWTELIPGVAFAPVYGDWQAEAHGKLVRFAPGAAAPTHTHTHAYRGVVVQGRLTNPYPGEGDPPVLGPGDAWYVPGGEPHSNACVSDEPCVGYTYGDAGWDIEVVGD